MPFLLGLFGGGKILDFAGKVLDFLRSPLGIVCIIAAVGFGGHLEGKWRAEGLCRLEKLDSVNRAREMDLGASTNADPGLQAALDEARAQLLTAQTQLRDQADESQRLPEELRRARLPSDSEWRRLQPPQPVRRSGKKSARRK